MANDTDEPLTEAERKEIFLALVEAQDEMGVPRSRKVIAQRYEIEESQVRQIEQEGLDAGWLD
jgi:hypothetical protein